MSANSSDAERNQTSGSVMSALDGLRRHRGLRRWARGLDKISEGVHVWPASALLTLGTLIMTVVWLCFTNTNDYLSVYLALKTETDLYDVITAVQRERQCVATCITSSFVR